ncbi:MAG: cation diffusion facilitator family transporter [Streptosporangiaceae bacterium]
MSRTQRLAVVLVLNLALVAGLGTVGATAHSLAVLAAGGDYLLDAAGVGLALLAIRLSARPAGRGRPAGYPNAQRLAALVNGGWLLVLELLVTGAAADRLIRGTPAVDGLPVLVVSAIAALGMAAGALVLLGGGDDPARQGGERDLSVAAILLDTIADAAAAAGVAVTGGIIAATHGWYWLDPAVALAIAVVIAYHAAALIRKALSPRPHQGAKS